MNKHLEQIFQKLCVENRTATAMLAARTLTRDKQSTRPETTPDGESPNIPFRFSSLRLDCDTRAGIVTVTGENCDNPRPMLNSLKYIGLVFTFLCHTAVELRMKQHSQEAVMARIKLWAVSVAVASALILPQIAQAADDLGYQAIRNHDWTAAEQQLLAGLQKDPNNSFAQLNLAWVYAQTGRKAEAEALYQEILKRDQDRVASLSSQDGQSMSQLAKRGLARLNNK